MTYWVSCAVFLTFLSLGHIWNAEYVLWTPSSPLKTVAMMDVNTHLAEGCASFPLDPQNVLHYLILPLFFFHPP